MPSIVIVIIYQYAIDFIHVTDLPVMEEEDALFRLAVKKLEAAEDAALDPPTEYRLGADGKSAKPVVRDKTFSTIYTST